MRFDSVKVFSATLHPDRQAIGDRITAWIADQRRRPGFALVDVSVRQSSDKGYHCLVYVVWYRKGAA